MKPQVFSGIAGLVLGLFLGLMIHGPYQPMKFGNFAGVWIRVNTWTDNSVVFYGDKPMPWKP